MAKKNEFRYSDMKRITRAVMGDPPLSMQELVNWQYCMLFSCISSRSVSRETMSSRFWDYPARGILFNTITQCIEALSETLDLFPERLLYDFLEGFINRMIPSWWLFQRQEQPKLERVVLPGGAPPEDV